MMIFPPRYRVHRLTDSINDMGSMNWDMFGAFLGAWIIVYLCIIKGVKSAGKVSFPGGGGGPHVIW